ncbi:ornithine cyclodeaminase family protein [Rhodoferax sp.]|jgi:alanine dehydrogenase|uniref:ornithine cyclodeaminase family protein n=1 Tax=Rhodoferax sp. TaxID=50421 RepID=UPI003784C26E
MSNNSRLLLINRDDVATLIVPRDVVAAVREAFELHGQGKGRVFPVIREQLSTGGVFGVKAGDVQSEGLLGFKAAGYWPNNREYGSEPHQGTILLIDPVTGRPLCVMDANAITTLRTGAAGALGLKYLARKESANLTIFGTGVQARSQLEFALDTFSSIRNVQYVSGDKQRNPEFEGLFDNRCNIKCASDVTAATSGADIVITATPGAGPLFEISDISAGTHLNCVGADTKGKRELPSGLLSFARLFVDDKHQAQQLGELQWTPDTVCEELGNLLNNKVNFERREREITIFDMTGLALQDLTVARLIYNKATLMGIGTSIPWPW